MTRRRSHAADVTGQAGDLPGLAVEVWSACQQARDAAVTALTAGAAPPTVAWVLWEMTWAAQDLQDAGLTVSPAEPGDLQLALGARATRSHTGGRTHEADVPSKVVELLDQVVQCAARALHVETDARLEEACRDAATRAGICLRVLPTASLEASQITGWPVDGLDHHDTQVA